MKKILLLSYFIIATAITTTAQCWQDIATGGAHSIGIKTNGTLWAWGYNTYGQLGDGTTANKLTAVQTSTAINWKSIACGGNHSLAIKTDGTLWAWGLNNNSQLGDGTTVNKLVPTQIGVATDWLFVNAGQNHSIAIKTDGTLWTCGLNSNSQLGDGTAVNKNVFTQIGVATNWQSASGGFDFTMAIQSNGTLWGFGLNNFKQLGDGTTITKTTPTQIGAATNWSVAASGQSHSIAVKTDGTLWSWGYNYEGALGSGVPTQNATPTQIGVATNWKAVAANYRHSLATKTDGTLWGFGINNSSQLGDGTTVNKNIPTQIGVATNWVYPKAGNSNSAAIQNNGTIWGWGSNSSGQIGDGTNVAKTTPVIVTTTCINGAALNFDGVNDFVSIGPVIPLNSSYTKEAWVYANASGSNNIISSGSAAFCLAGGQLSTFNNGGAVIQDPAIFPLNQWVHVAVTFDGITLKLYKNGLLVNSTNSSGYPADAIGIGQYGITGSNFFQGSMDEVRIWNVARTQCEINTYKDCEISTTATGLLANYHFNQGFAASNNSLVTVATDASGNSNNGSLTNFALTGATSNWVASGGVVSGFTTTLAPPVISVNSGVICSGNSFTMVPSGASTYSYSSGAAVVSPTANVSYSVTGTSSLGCVSSNTAVSSVTVNATPTVSVTSGVICNGQSFTITPSGASTYTVQGGSAIVSPASTTNYTVIGTSAAGCVGTNTATSNVLVNALPILVAASQTICTGATATLIASGASTYTWSTGANTNTIALTPASTTVYTLNGTSAAGCNASALTVTVTLGSAPSIAVNSSTICSGNSTTLTASGVSTYTWSNGATTSSIIVSPTTNTVYAVNGNLAGCSVVATNNATVTLNTTPTVSANSGAICNGQSFTITPSGASTYTVQGGSNVVSPTSTINYTVIGTSAQGCVSAITATSSVSVSSTPTISVNSGGICNGQSFTITPSGASTYTIQGGSTVVSPTSTTNYSVTGTSALGCVSSNAAVSSVTVNTLPTISVNSGAICSGQSFTMTPSGANTFTYSNGSNVAIPTSSSASYTVTGTDANGCVSSVGAVSNVTVNICTPAAALNFDGADDYVMTNSNISHGNNFTYEAWVNPLTAIQWGGIMTTSSLGGQSQWVQITLNPTGALRAEIVDDAGNNKWYEGNTSLLGTWHHIAVSFDGTNLLFYVDGNVESTSAISNSTLGNMTINSQLNIGAERNHSVFYNGNIDEVRVWNVARTQCQINTYKDSEIPTTATGLLANYHFNQGFDAANNPTEINLMDASGNSNNGTLTNFALTGSTSNWVAPGGVVSGYTIALAPPTVGATVTNSVICSGNMTTLNGSGATTYTWTNGVTDAIAFSPTTTATYTVIGTLASTGCSNTAVSSVTVNTLPTISVNSGAICLGQSFTMTPIGAATYTFSNGSAIATPSANATYSVGGTDANGCIGSVGAVSNVTVNTLPVVSAATNNTLLCTGQTATLTASGATTYTWSTTQNSTNIAVSPTATAVYTVIGTDANGCANTVTITQNVSACTGIVSLTNINASINVYPNPNNGLFVIELTTTSKVIITNALGQIVMTETFEAGKHDVNIYNEATGVYFVKVIENNTQQMIKIIKE